jgi:hypothetical protein
VSNSVARASRPTLAGFVAHAASVGQEAYDTKNGGSRWRWAGTANSYTAAPCGLRHGDAP